MPEYKYFSKAPIILLPLRFFKVSAITHATNYILYFNAFYKNLVSPEISYSSIIKKAEGNNPHWDKSWQRETSLKINMKQKNEVN